MQACGGSYDRGKGPFKASVPGKGTLLSCSSPSHPSYPVNPLTLPPITSSLFSPRCPLFSMSSRPKQSMSELKLRRLLEHNQRLREDLGRPRIRVSEASASLIRYCKTTTDHLVSSLSSLLPLPKSISQSNHLPSFLSRYPPYLSTDIVLYFLQVPSVWGPVGKNEDPYAPQGGGKCCVVQ